MFGYFAQVNFHLYHYAGNNPVRYIDPDGEQISIPSPLGVPIIVPVYPILIDDSKKPILLDDGIISKDGRHLMVDNDDRQNNVGDRLKDSAGLSNPNSDLDNNDNDEDESKTLSPEDIEEYNKNVREQYNEQLSNSQSSTENPWSPSNKNGPSDTPQNLRGWRKVVYVLGKITELFDNINQ